MIHYGLVDRRTGEMVDVRLGTAAARGELHERTVRGEDVLVQPVMLRSDYARMPSDYRSEKEGVPYLLYMGMNGGTTYGPVILLDNWGKWSEMEHHRPLESVG